MKKKLYIFFIICLIVLGLFILMASLYFYTKKEKYNNKGNEKIILELMHDDTKGLSFQETEAIVDNEKINNIKFELENEIEQRFFDQEKDYISLKKMIDYIKIKFNVEIGSDWKYYINKISDKSGFVSFVYFINDEISTNRSITFEINDDNIDNVYYSYVNDYVNEKKIIEKVENFKKNTIQEKKKIKDKEKIIDEKTTYSYNYRIDRIIYTYCLFFKNDHGTINNSYGSTYFVE